MFFNTCAVAGKDAETIYYLYVTDEEQRLVGVASLRDLILADRNHRMSDRMSSSVITVYGDTSLDVVSEIMKKYGLLAVPVIEPTGKLVSIVTFDDILEIL
jgi:magnesium transporter